MSLKDELRKKITKSEDMPYFSIAQLFMDSKRNYISPPWWLMREYGRIETEVYPIATEVIDSLNVLNPQYALHIAEEDPTQIAYTPDKSYGEADRQVRTGLARFITKYYPHLPDDYIRDLQAEHLSELDSTFEVLTGEDMIAVYTSGAVGACMSKADSSYHGQVNPTKVYDVPNVGMAVLRDKDGKISARTMVYTPTPSDKRFIRCYGDSKLRSKLERSGYRAGTWHGVVFQTIPMGPSYADTYIMPYLDGEGGMGSSEKSMVALIDHKITSITLEMSSNIKRINPSGVQCATSTSGSIILGNVDSTKFKTTCMLTGVEINLLTQKSYDFWDGVTLGKITDTSEHEDLDRVYYTTNQQARVLSTAPRFITRGRYYIDTTSLRLACGFVRLDPTLYPEEQGWFLKADYDNPAVETAEGAWIKRADAVYVATLRDGGTQFKYAHESTIGIGYVKLHAIHKGILYYAAPGVKVVKTVTGRKVIPELYSVVQLYNGQWEFSRNAMNYQMLNKYYYFPRGTLLSEYATPGCDFYNTELENYLLNGDTPYTGSRDTTVNSWNSRALYLIKRYVDNYAMIDGVPLRRYPTVPTWAKLWSLNTVKNSAIGRAINKVIGLIEAAAHAVDYNMSEEEAHRFIALERSNEIAAFAKAFQNGSNPDDVIAAANAAISSATISTSAAYARGFATGTTNISTTTIGSIAAGTGYVTNTY